MLHKETVAERTLDLIKKLSTDEKFKDFNLVGGTALALQIGHRKSVDIDLFSGKNFDVRQLADHLKNNYPVSRIDVLGQTIYSIIDSIKLTAIPHRYNDVNPPTVVEGVRMASLDDIAAMKVHAIHNNGTRYKDFLDIYHLLEHMPFNKMMQAYKTKYPDMYVATAEMALRDHKAIDIDYDLKSLGRKVPPSEVLDRITDALNKPEKTYKATKHHKKDKDDPNQRLRRRRHRGH
jgi:hypothetical protein